MSLLFGGATAVGSVPTGIVDVSPLRSRMIVRGPAVIRFVSMSSPVAQASLKDPNLMVPLGFAERGVTLRYIHRGVRHKHGLSVREDGLGTFYGNFYVVIDTVVTRVDLNAITLLIRAVAPDSMIQKLNGHYSVRLVNASPNCPFIRLAITYPYSDVFLLYANCMLSEFSEMSSGTTASAFRFVFVCETVYLTNMMASRLLF